MMHGLTLLLASACGRTYPVVLPLLLKRQFKFLGLAVKTATYLLMQLRWPREFVSLLLNIFRPMFM